MNLNRTYITDALEAPCLLNEMPDWFDFFCLKNNSSTDPQKTIIVNQDGDINEGEYGASLSDLTYEFNGKLIHLDLASAVKDHLYYDGFRARSLPLAIVGTAIFQKLDDAFAHVIGHVIMTISQCAKSKAIKLEIFETGRTLSHILGLVNPHALDQFKLVNSLLPESPKNDLKALHVYCLQYVLAQQNMMQNDTLYVNCMGIHYSISSPLSELGSQTIMMRSNFGLKGDLSLIVQHDVLEILKHLQNSNS